MTIEGGGGGGGGGGTYIGQFMPIARTANFLFSKFRGGNSKFFANAKLAILNL